MCLTRRYSCAVGQALIQFMLYSDTRHINLTGRCSLSQKAIIVIGHPDPKMHGPTVLYTTSTLFCTLRQGTRHLCWYAYTHQA